MKLWWRSLMGYFRRLSKMQRILVYCVGCYVLFVMLLGMATPALLERQLPARLSSELGRSVTLTRVHINPFLLRVTVNDIAIADEPPQPPQPAAALLKVKQISAQVEFWQSLFTWTPTVKYVHILAPQAHIAVYRSAADNNAMRFNFSSIIESLQSGAGTAPDRPAASSTIMPLRVDDISLTQGQLTFNDAIYKADFAYQGIELQLKDLDLQAQIKTEFTAGKTPWANLISQGNNRLTFSATAHNKQKLTLAGNFQLAPLHAFGEMSLQNFTLTDIWPYVRDKVSMSLTDGLLNSSVRFEVASKDKTLNYRLLDGQLGLNQVLLMAHSDAKVAPRLAWRTLQIGAVSLDSASQQVDIDKVIMHGLDINGHYDANGLDVQRLLTPAKASAAPASESNASSSDWVANIEHIGVDGSLLVTDNLLAKNVTWQLSPLLLTVNKISSDFHRPLDYKLGLGVTNRQAESYQRHGTLGKVSIDGNVDVAKATISADIGVDKFDLSALQPYLQPYANLIVHAGRFSSKGSVTSQWQQGNTQYSGSLHVSELAVNDRSKDQPLLAWRALDIDKLKFEQGNKTTLSIGDIRVQQPFAKVVVYPDRSTNLSAISVTQEDVPPAKLQKTPATSDSKAVGTSAEVKSAPHGQRSALALKINKIDVIDGNAYFADLFIRPNFSSAIRSINGSVTALKSGSADTSPAQVSLHGKIDQYAPISLTGEIDPLADLPYLNVILEVKSAELTSVSPYSGTYAGYYVDKGQLSLSLQYLLDHGQLKGANKVYIDQLQLGKPSNSSLATSLPVKLALALLQDKNGVIDLKVDVSGDVDDPNFGVGSIIWTAFKNVITKAVSAPFSLLADLVGSDEELDKVTFAAGSADLSPTAKEMLATLADALNERPQLTLDLLGNVNPQADASALAEQAVAKKLLAIDSALELPVRASYIAAAARLKRAVAILYEQQSGQTVAQQREALTEQLTIANGTAPQPDELEIRLYVNLYRQLLSAETISDDQLHALATQRAKNVKSELVNTLNIAPQRVFLRSGHQDQSQQSEVLLTLDAN